MSPGAPQREARHPGGMAGWLAVWGPRLVALGAGLVPLAVLYHIFWSRLSYPLDLEWMEGGMLVHAKRLADGQGLYVAPSVDFGSFLYTPLYPWLLGWLGKIFGLGYTLGRTLSVLCLTATFGIMARAALRAAGVPRRVRWSAPASPPVPRWGPGGIGLDALAFAALSGGAVAVAFSFTGGWYDLVRNDGLQIALSAGGLYALGVAGRTYKGVVVAGLLLGLAFFAKQTAVFPILAAGTGLCLIRLRLVPLLVAVVGAVAGLGTLALNHATHGWFWFYIFELHQSHRTTPAQVWEVAPRLLWAHGRFLYLAGVAALGLWAAGVAIRRRFATWTPLWGLAAIAGLVAGAVGRATQWSENNAFIPAIVFPAIFVAVAASEAAGLLSPHPEDDAQSGWRGAILGRLWLLRSITYLPALLVGIHLVVTGLPDRRRHVPDARAWATAKRHIDLLHRLGKKGEVYVPYHPWYSVIAGGPGHGHVMNVNDVNFTRPIRPGEKGGLLGDPRARRKRVLSARRRLIASIRQALTRGRFSAVIHDRPVIQRWRRRGDRAVPVPNHGYLSQVPGLLRSYRLEWNLGWDGAAPRTYEGNPSAPRYLWRRPRDPKPPAGGRVVFDFERPDLTGWDVMGKAFGHRSVDGLLWDPKRRRAQGLVAGAGGRRWLSSFHGGDAATGQARSPVFVLDRPMLRLRVGGGRQLGHLEVRLLIGKKVVKRATGNNSERFRTVRWNVAAFRGQRARLEVVDQATGGWGHLQLDDVWLVP